MRKIYVLETIKPVGNVEVGTILMLYNRRTNFIGVEVWSLKVLNNKSKYLHKYDDWDLVFWLDHSKDMDDKPLFKLVN